MPVRRNSSRCDVTLDDLEEDHTGFTPPPPYSGRHSEEPGMNNKKLKKQWTSAALAVSDEEKKKKMQEVLNVWEGQGATFKEFIDNTTVHGVKHIFEESPYKVRRILWVICFLAALISLIVQVAIRTNEYYKHKTNVDVQVKYVPSMEFPAVTICNQNAFRMTKVVNLEMYEFVDYVFATDMSDIDLENYRSYSSVNSTEFLQNTAHQLEDMIDGCYYNTRPCDISRDFKRTFSDMGICYTFNHDPNDVKMVTESGAGYGLRLILNVEQYQAMRGPQNDAGLKLLLHQQNEFPAVKNLGFSVAPGTHTLVGVYVKEVSGIEPPWGICSHTAQPLNNCKRQCKADMVANSCQCVDAHMADEGVAGQDGHMHTAQDVCDLPTLWGCVRNVTDHLQTDGDGCACDIPCTRTTYEPRLSYAQLSRINIDRLVLKKAAQKERAVESFEQSLETLQRVDSTIIEEDERVLTQLQELVSDLGSIVDLLNETLGSGCSLREDLKDMAIALGEDIETVDDFEDVIEDEIDKLDKDQVKVTEYMLLQMYKMLGSPEEATESLLEAKACVSLTTIPLPHPDNTEAEDVIRRYTSGMEGDWHPSYISAPSNDSETPVVPSTELCNEQIINFIEAMQEFYHVMEATHEYSLSFMDTYNEIVRNIYSGTLRNASSIEEHMVCNDFMQNKFVPIFDNDVIQLIAAFDDVRTSRNKLELENSFDAVFQESMTTELTNYTMWFDEMKRKCWWMDDWMDSGDKFEDNLERGEDYFKMAQSYSSSSMEQVTKLATQLEKIKGHVEDEVAYYTNLTALYLGEDITKLTMAQAFSALEASKVFEDLMTENTDYKSEWDTLEDKFKTIISNYKMGFYFLLQMELPVIKEDTIKEMEFLNFLKALNESRMTPVIEDIMENTIVTFKNIQNFFFEIYVDGPAESQKDMTREVGKISSVVTTIRTKMSTYLASAEIDQEFLLNNFLQVDVFYPEISYDSITQHKAFEILSLFSEVGGFLGLLLGASVLSLIELVDYIVMLCTRKWKDKNQVKNNSVKKF